MSLNLSVEPEVTTTSHITCNRFR